jgi:hypothetical protein
VRQLFRLLVTGSRTWHDVQTVEQALAVILDRHPEDVLLVHGACPRAALHRVLAATRNRQILGSGPDTGTAARPGGNQDGRAAS